MMMINKSMVEAIIYGAICEIILGGLLFLPIINMSNSFRENTASIQADINDYRVRQAKQRKTIEEMLENVRQMRKELEEINKQK